MPASHRLALSTLILTSGITVLTVSNDCFAANPADPGSSGFTQIYVDSTGVGTNTGTVTPCHLVGGVNVNGCGTSLKPYKNLREALTQAGPGSEVIIAGHTPTSSATNAYYNVDDGLPGSAPFANQDFLKLPLLEGSTSSLTTIIRGWENMPKPRVRGTMRFNNPQVVNAAKYLYAIDWNVVGEGAAKKVNGTWTYSIVPPQQLYRGDIQLQQVGGTLYLGQDDGVTSSPDVGYGGQTTWPVQTALRKVGRIPASGNTPWDSLSPNQFYYHGATNKLYFRLASALNTGEHVEASVQQFLLRTANVKNLLIRNIIFERSNGSAYSPQNAAVTLSGANIVLWDMTIQSADAICLAIYGQAHSIGYSNFQHCGQLGIHVTGTSHVISGNAIHYNNTKGFDENWVAGGIKLISFNPPTTPAPNEPPSYISIQYNTVAFNAGTGIWLDTQPSFITIKENRLAFNGAYNTVADISQTAVPQPAGTIGIGIRLEATNNNNVFNNAIIGSAHHGIQLVGTCNTINNNIMFGNGSPGLSQLLDSRVIPQAASCTTSPSSSTYWNTITNNGYYWNNEAPNFAGGTPFYFAVQLLDNNKQVAGNKYCGSTGPYYQRNTSDYYTFGAWQSAGSSLGIDTAASGATANKGPYVSSNPSSPAPGNAIANVGSWPQAFTTLLSMSLPQYGTYLSSACTGAGN